MWLGVGTDYEIYKVYPDMWTNFLSLVGQDCPASQCPVPQRFNTKKSSTYFQFSASGSINYQNGTVSGVFGQDKICLFPFRGCTQYKMRFLVVKSATEKFKVIKNATGILGLSP